MRPPHPSFCPGSGSDVRHSAAVSSLGAIDANEIEQSDEEIRSAQLRPSHISPRRKWELIEEVCRPSRTFHLLQPHESRQNLNVEDPAREKWTTEQFSYGLG